VRVINVVERLASWPPVNLWFTAAYSKGCNRRLVFCNVSRLLSEQIESQKWWIGAGGRVGWAIITAKIILSPSNARARPRRQRSGCRRRHWERMYKVASLFKEIPGHQTVTQERSSVTPRETCSHSNDSQLIRPPSWAEEHSSPTVERH
jgi:hypothetical protein